MSVETTIIEQMQKGPPSPNGEILAGDGDRQWRILFADWDRLGCLVDRLELNVRRPITLEAERVAQELSYLGEELRIIERDAKDGRIILRSLKPQQDGNQIAYYEMILIPTRGISLMRWRYDRNLRERSPISIPIARQTLDRLVKDLSRFAV